jgi:hypothetical protein
MGRGDRPKVRWKKDRQMKKKAARKAKSVAKGQARKAKRG